MPEPSEIPLVLDATPRRGRPLLAWIVIVVIAAVVIVLTAYRPSGKVATGKQRTDLLLLELQARQLVGTAELFSRQDQQLVKQARALDTGPVSHRLRAVILEGELASPEEALARLRELNRKAVASDVELTAEERSSIQDLESLYDDYVHQQWDGPSLSLEQRQFLRTELGWFGELALAPAGGPNLSDREGVLRAARRTTIVFLTAAGGAFLLLVPGMAALVTLGVLLAIGKVRSKLDLRFPNGAFYAETFAIWITLFLLLSLLAALVPLPGSQFLLSGVAMLLSLSALAWPVFRGVPWCVVRQEVGWHGGRHPLVELVMGLVSYAMALPLLIVGGLLTLLLMLLKKGWPGASPSDDSFLPIDQPSHPVVEVVSGAGVWQVLQLLFLASVVAPLVEETMFRGVLHRHLREASQRWGFLLSFLFSSAVVSFLFAAIHPQGFVAIPTLMALAFAFSLAREWRGSLIPAMVAHGLHNGALLLFLILATAE